MNKFKPKTKDYFPFFAENYGNLDKNSKKSEFWACSDLQFIKIKLLIFNPFDKK